MLCSSSSSSRVTEPHPLMLAVGVGHTEVVSVLLSHPDIRLEMKDSYGKTAVFHTCNHGHH